jgi:hypothetical protein
VVGLLRGVAGELSDLIEAGLPTGDTPGRGAPGDKGETKGPTPGPGEEKVKKEPLSASQYTYSEGEEEEAITKEEEVEAPGDPPKEAPEKQQVTDRDEGGEASVRKTEQAGPVKSEPSERERAYRERISGKFRPDYLTRNLQLQPTGKASAAPKRGSGDSRKAAKTSSEAGPSGHHHHGGDGGRRADRACSPERSPLRRRPRPGGGRNQDQAKKKKKKSKGVKRRQRGRDFRAGKDIWRRDRGRW